MDAKVLKLSLAAIFLISLASLGAIILFINPHKTGFFGLALFSVVLIMMLLGLFSGLGFWLRRKYITPRNLDRILGVVLRQGAFIAILATAYLWLSHFRLFKVWTVLVILFLIIGTEYYFLTHHENRSKTTG